MRTLNLLAGWCLVSFAALAHGACDSGSAAEKLRCLLNEVCPDPASEAERVACYRMVEAALRDGGREAAETETAAQVSSQERSAIESGTASAAGERDRGADTAAPEDVPATEPPAPVRAEDGVVEAPVVEAPEPTRGQDPVEESGTPVAARVAAPEGAEPARAVEERSQTAQAAPGEDEPRTRRRWLPFRRIMSEKETPPGWARVVHAHSELRGTEIVVLDNGDIWLEDEGSKFFHFRRRDLVRVSEDGVLVRQDGMRANVSRVVCDRSRKLEGRCKLLRKYLE